MASTSRRAARSSGCTASATTLGSRSPISRSISRSRADSLRSSAPSSWRPPASRRMRDASVRSWVAEPSSSARAVFMSPTRLAVRSATWACWWARLLAMAWSWDFTPSNSARIQCSTRAPFSLDSIPPPDSAVAGAAPWAATPWLPDAAGCAAAGRDVVGRGGSGRGMGPMPDAGARGVATGTARAKTSGQPENLPVQTVSHTEHVQAAAPAFIG